MKTILFLSLFVSHLTFATIVPQHEFVLGDDWNNGYPEKKYHQVLDKIIEIYEPIIQSKGGTLHILRDWRDGSVNAWAWRIGQEYHLEVPGGMSRYHLINEEAFILTVCHELGHLLGGAPARNRAISLEGQADYFATTHCAKRVLPQIEPYKKTTPTQDMQNLCARENDRDLCYRILSGSQSLSNYFASIARNSFPTLSQESQRQVNQTLTTHPKAQCRLDTFKRGTFCHKNEGNISFDDPKLGYCTEKDDLKRPRCWYFAK